MHAHLPPSKTPHNTHLECVAFAADECAQAGQCSNGDVGKLTAHVEPGKAQLYEVPTEIAHLPRCTTPICWPLWAQCAVLATAAGVDLLQGVGVIGGEVGLGAPCLGDSHGGAARGLACIDDLTVDVTSSAGVCSKGRVGRGDEQTLDSTRWQRCGDKAGCVWLSTRCMSTHHTCNIPDSQYQVPLVTLAGLQRMLTS